MTPDTVRTALEHISPACPRDEWVRVAMAIKSEFTQGVGFDLFDTWSQGAPDAYRADDTRSTWRSIKPQGGVTIATLLDLAKRNGWAPPKPVSVNQYDAIKRHPEISKAAAIEQQEVSSAQARAAENARRIWADAQPVNGNEHHYLRAKSVQAYGLRIDKSGALLVPLCDEGGNLWNLQFIAQAGGSGPPKRFLKGSRKSGLWHWVGSRDELPRVFLVSEGYATAASLHEATGYPVAVAFDAGNLPKVAKALRKLYPQARMVICGDDDQVTERDSGRNPGKEKANTAAKAVNGVAVFPQDLPDGGSDFNDMAAHAGLEAVRTTIEAGLLLPSRATMKATQSQDRFSVTDSGVYFHGVDREGRSTEPHWVCSALHVEAVTRDTSGSNWGYLLTFKDLAGVTKQWAMPARLLSGEGNEYRGYLLSLGLAIAPGAKARNLLTEYIQTRKPNEQAICTDRVGWHGRAFVLPHCTIGHDVERVVFQSDSAMENTFTTRGSAETWRNQVAILCAGNSRLVFAVSCAFAGALLHPAGLESGGFHFRGDSSSGKTTALKAAASVFGGPGYLQRWRTTDNALEAIAAQHCDSLLILDELAQVDPKTAGECAYMLANEQSKARATRNGAPRARLSWRLLFLSAGELSLADHMAEGFKRARTGQEVRMADIPADAGEGLGAFETLHRASDGATLSTLIVDRARLHHGAVGTQWLNHLATHAEGLRKRTKEHIQGLANTWTPDHASGQVRRVATRFALVAAAGEMATAAGLTGWPRGEAESAAYKCFESWIAARGGAGNGEVLAMLRQVRSFFEQHGEGRFTWWHRAADDHNAKTLNRAGVRRLLNAQGEPIKTNSEHMQEYGDRIPAQAGEGVMVEYFVLPDVFRIEICKGFDPQTVLKQLEQHGCIGKRDEGRYTAKQRLPGIGPANCYHITPSVFALDV